MTRTSGGATGGNGNVDAFGAKDFRLGLRINSFLTGVECGSELFACRTKVLPRQRTFTSINLADHPVGKNEGGFVTKHFDLDIPQIARRTGCVNKRTCRIHPR